jgi:hypothetical protein
MDRCQAFVLRYLLQFHGTFTRHLKRLCTPTLITSSFRHKGEFTVSRDVPLLGGKILTRGLSATP